jgi:amidase
MTTGAGRRIERMAARGVRLAGVLTAGVLTTGVLIATMPQIAAADQIKYEPTAGVPTFAVREPVLRIKPGDIVETRTFSKPGDYYERAGGPWPGEVGPFLIEGVTPEDTLVVKILKLRPNRDTAVSAVNPNGISAVAGDSRTRMLNDPLPARRFVWQIDRTRNVGILELPNSASKKIELPLKPMLGRVAVAPQGEEAWGGLWPGNFGGNMDASDVREGTTVYLPVFHPGALFYFGDAHALQGDGEIVGSGLETTMDVTFQFDVIKGQRIRWPRYEDADYIMVAGSVRPLVDAFRIAHVELIEWLVKDYGFDKMEAYQVLSQAGVTRVANVVDPNYTVVAKFPKSALPPKVTKQ